jgi:membrane protein implicated in regulation of membrane protease activity
MNQIWGGIVTVLTAIIGVAILATLVSKQANTAGVLQAGGSAFSGILGTALSPVTGGSGLGSIGNFSNIGGLTG